MSRRRKFGISLIIASLLLSYQNCTNLTLNRPQQRKMDEPPPVPPPVQTPPNPSPEAPPMENPSPSGGLTGTNLGTPVTSSDGTNVNALDFAFNKTFYTGKYFVLAGACSDRGTIRFGPGQFDIFRGAQGGGLYVFSKDGTKKARANICWDASQNRVDEILASWGITDPTEVNNVKKNVGDVWDHDWGGVVDVVSIAPDRIALLAGGDGGGGMGIYRGVLLYQINQDTSGNLSLTLVKNYPLLSTSSRTLGYAQNRLYTVASSFRSNYDSSYKGQYLYVFDEQLNLISQRPFASTEIFSRELCRVNNLVASAPTVTTLGLYQILDSTLSNKKISGFTGVPVGFACQGQGSKLIAQISKSQAKLFHESGGALIEDGLLTAPRPLSDGDALGLGSEAGTSASGDFSVLGPFVWRGLSNPIELKLQALPGEDPALANLRILFSSISEDGFVVFGNTKRVQFFKVQ